MLDNKTIFLKWLYMLCEDNEISDIEALPPEMIEKEIQDIKLLIINENVLVRGSPKTRTAVLHSNNVEIMTEYIKHLETILFPMHTLQIVFRTYEDPDELPERIFFDVPTTVTMPKLRATIIKVRDKVKNENLELCVEDTYTRIFDDTCISLGEKCTWRNKQFADVYLGIENIWLMKA